MAWDVCVANRSRAAANSLVKVAISEVLCAAIFRTALSTFPPAPPMSTADKDAAAAPDDDEVDDAAAAAADSADANLFKE